jgi:hypothetical protein
MLMKKSGLEVFYETLEYGRGFIIQQQFWIDRRIGYDKLWRFAEEYGYYIKVNNKTKKYEIYNFSRVDVRTKFPEIYSSK